MDKKVCFYVEGQTSIIDTVTSKDGRGTFSRETAEEIQVRYPGAEIVPFDYACERIDERLKEIYPMLQPKEITEEKWWEMFECLPPMQYNQSNKGTSFKMSEMTCGNITSGYVLKNDKYYSMNVRLHTKHEEMLAVIN